jgi:TolB-like protein
MNIKNSRNPSTFISLLFALYFLFFTACVGYVVQSSHGEGNDFKEKIALFPFDNLSNDKDALIYVMPVLKNILKKKGLEVIDEDNLNKFLCRERVITNGHISKDIALKIRERFGVNTILTGSIISFVSGENPKFGISARLINSSNGNIIWADYASATGDDFTKILGLGKLRTMDSLIPKVMERLFTSFSTTLPYKEIESTYKIAVMPFQNKSRFRDAGKIATYMFLVELFKNQVFEPVEYGNVRKLIVDLRVRSRGELTYKNIEALSKFLGVDGVLVGTVELYSDRVGVSSAPEVAITARLLDARKNRILWYNSYQLNGEENIIVFDWGRMRSVDKVAYKVVSKLVEKMETVKWHKQQSSVNGQ